MDTRYTISSTAGAFFAIWDRQKRQIVERHKTFAKAQTAAKRLNRQCLQCGEVLPQHSPTCTFRLFERDHSFGAEADDDSEVAR